jgi:glutamate formiminotransferase/formiminotetrahydrofolate cyclodeaminase
MPPAPKLIDLTLAQFGDRLAERSATPGGGSVAAHLAGLGAALTVMAFRFTSGAAYAACEADMARRVEALERLRQEALALVDRDSQAYDAVTAAYKLPKASDADKAARTAAIQQALTGAMEVPVETMDCALAGLRACAAGAADVNPNLASDCAAGALCLASAVEAAHANVRINASGLQDKALAARRLAECEAWRREARELAESVRATIDRKLG